MNRLHIGRRAQILHCLWEENSIRATARLTDVAINTVVKLLCEAGKACSDYQNKVFARFAQNYAVQVSEFVRKRFLRVRRDGNWLGAARKSNNGVTFPINSIFSRPATIEPKWILI